jgi:hypothetical protein
MSHPQDAVLSKTGFYPLAWSLKKREKPVIPALNLLGNLAMPSAGDPLSEKWVSTTNPC